MSASVAIVPTSPLPNKYDPALKPNPHPYPIKTTHSGVLSRSNSSGHNTPSRYFYTPPPTPTRGPTKSRPDYRTHRHSTSLTNDLPMPLPSPLTSRHSEVDDVSLRRQRADTLPSYIDAVSAEPEEDLPHNPKTWTPSQLSVYLTAALHVRSGARLPERVAHDITSWVRREAVTGRTFLRWTDDDLQALGVNTLWRGALLVAARNLRQNMLRGRIWGTPTSEPDDDDESNGYAFPSVSSSPDLALTSDADTVSVHANANTNGHVRGMVDKWERSSNASSRSSSRSSNHREPTSTSVVSPLPLSSPSPFPSQGQGVSEEEPSIEDLLLAEDGSWGARAWEDIDVGVTVRRVDPAHDTIVPLREGSGSGSSNGIGGGARRRVVDIFADEPSSSAAALTSDAGVQVDAYPRSPPAENDEDVQQVEEEARERALEEEVRETRTLLEEFRRRLEDVEARVGVMEAQQQQRSSSKNKTHNDKAVEAAIPEVIRVVPHAAPSCDDDDDSSSERAVVRGGGVGLGPESVSEIPSYVFLVGLGVCTVVLQVVLKRVAGRSLKS